MTDARKDQQAMPESPTPENPAEMVSTDAQIERLYTIQRITAKLGAVEKFDQLKLQLLTEISALYDQKRVLLFLSDDEGAGLNFAGISRALENEEAAERLTNSTVKTFNSEDASVKSVLSNTAVLLDNSTISNTPFSDLASLLEITHLYLLPLTFNTTLTGLLVLEVQSKDSLTDIDRQMLSLLALNIAVILNNKRQHDGTVEQLAARMHEMGILQQIDQELNDTIELNTVFNMTCDWALRFTNANAASLALYEEDTDTLRTMFNYGYSIADEQIEMLRGQTKSSIAYRVARTGRAEVVPDVSIDLDYQPVEHNIVSQMSVPVLREEQVVAVLTLESKKLNAFTDDHLRFVKNLANRAAVAIDNARLYTESERERNKLSHILRNIVDIVIVINPEGRIMMMNQSAISALRLYSETEYTGRTFDEAIDFRPLVDIYHKVRDAEESLTDEITMPNNRVFYTKADQHEGIGWIIVMQDVTPYKEMDRLKSELIATVSHDLKQPLSVMRGYLDLLQMKNTFDPSSENFVNMIDRAIQNMRQLIDDLLDLAKIESGIDLSLEPVSLNALIQEVVDINSSTAINKSMTVITEIPEELLVVKGELNRLHQIFNNLVGNAIKYTPPEGEVQVKVEKRGGMVRVSVQDNGLGISPEDQAHIFERFYRVRRPETESIDGTGLGLAIVKSLVEAHQGTIRLESTLGSGSTFFVTLPLGEEDVPVHA